MKPSSKKFVNRELSWLAFNQRVLDEAMDPRVPLLERLNFLAISASNLDEFFMVRVGGLELVADAGVTARDPSGRTPAQQLAAIHRRVRQMVKSQTACLQDLTAQIEAEGVRRLATEDISHAQRHTLHEFFEEEIFSVVSPITVRDGADLPLISNLRLYMAVRLASPSGAPNDATRHAIIPIGLALPRLLQVHSRDRYAYILLEDVIRMFLDELFPGQTIEEAAPFRITRHAATAVEDEFAADLLSAMESVLGQRRTSACVRIEISADASPALRTFLRDALGVRAAGVYPQTTPIDLAAQRTLMDIHDMDHLRYPNWSPSPSAQVDLRRPMFEQIAERNILLFHPYESFDPVVRLLQEAADAPNVLAIKQVLYRTSADSPVIMALKRAAENGKYVTVLVEIKARFDEARNIHWCRALEEIGVQVVYGVRGLKTHAKVCMIVRRESRGIVRYCHFGTGNYNDKTARLYSDVGYMTRDADLGTDVSAFFNAITGYSDPRPYLKLSQAPTGLRDRIIQLIRGETQRKKAGQDAWIKAKMNALVDPLIIDELYKASRAGVRIQLSIRGICCLRPGVRGMSANITVVSVIDRYLEHARIFCFLQGGTKPVFISSADWMPRNLRRRVELMVPVDDPSCRRRLEQILDTDLADNVKGRVLLADGSYISTLSDDFKRGRRRSQEQFYRAAVKAAEDALRQQQTVFVPHRSRGGNAKG